MNPLKPLLLTAATALLVAAPASAAAPGNNDFANAYPVDDDGTATLHATTQEATWQFGEPSHGGADRSVWFRYKPEKSAGTRIQGDCGQLVVRVYTGTFSELKPIGQTNACAADVGWSAVEDTTYHIAVDAAAGKTPGPKDLTLDSRTDKPNAMLTGGAFDTIAPSGSRAVIETTGAPGARFLCSETGMWFKPLCKTDANGNSALTWSGLAPGKHTFNVNVVDAYANTDETPLVLPVNVVAPAEPTDVNTPVATPQAPAATPPAVTTAPSVSQPRAAKPCAVKLSRAGKVAKKSLRVKIVTSSQCWYTATVKAGTTQLAKVRGKGPRRALKLNLRKTVKPGTTLTVTVKTADGVSRKLTARR